METTFVDAAKTRKAEAGAVYAVVGPDSSEEFRGRLEEVCPVVVDEDARGVCLLIDGDPAEWKAVDRRTLARDVRHAGGNSGGLGAS